MKKKTTHDGGANEMAARCSRDHVLCKSKVVRYRPPVDDGSLPRGQPVGANFGAEPPSDFVVSLSAKADGSAHDDATAAVGHIDSTGWQP